MKTTTMHEPVMVDEILRLARGGEVPIRRIWDATFGRGGHSRAMLKDFPEAEIFAIDRDPSARQFAESQCAELLQSGRLKFFAMNFHDIPTIEANGFFGLGGFDVVLMDLGVSSPQLDDPGRGFSFYHDGPLDMRMDPSQGKAAHEVVNSWTEVGLARLFTELGEVPRPHRVAKAIIERRREKPFATTAELAGLIEKVEGWRTKGRHPATQYFLALRLLVNEELDGLRDSLPILMEKALSPNGRLMVITFHSLEDRIVKHLFKEREDLGRPVNKKVIVPTRTEILRNPRARSAKLRVFQRGSQS